MPERLLLVVLYCITLTLPSTAATRILFLGLSGEGAPAMEKLFDRQLRDRINTMPELSVMGYDESQRHRRTLEIDRNGSVAEMQLAALEELLPDSVFVIWAQVKKLTLAAVRKNLIRAEIMGELQTGLTVYNLSRKIFSYHGIVESNASKRKEFVFFEPIGLTHISAADREELIGKLVDDAVTGCADIIESLRRSEQSAPVKTVAREDTLSNRQPSISDVFAVPSMEAAEISGRAPASRSNAAPKVADKKNTAPSSK